MPDSPTTTKPKKKAKKAKRKKAKRKKKAKKKPRSRAGRRRRVRKSRILTPADERAASRGYWFDEDRAADVVAFMKRFLVHNKGEWKGQPFDPLPWQRKRFIEPLYGWMHPDVDPDTGPLRRFKTFYLEVPKKNGKSTLLGALSIVFLVFDNEPAAEIYCAAVDRQQAGIIYRAAAGLLMQSDLNSRLKLIESTKRIVYPAQQSYICAMSGDSGSNEGPDAHAVLIDELHAHKSRALWETLRYAGAARRQPVFGSITTAGYDRESLCWEQHEYAKGVLDGTIDDDRFLALIYGHEDSSKIDMLAPEVHAAANPSLGVLIDPEDLMEMAKEADKKPRSRNSFLRYRLGAWTESAKAWLVPEDWNKCGPPPGTDPINWRARALIDLAKNRCFAGLDLGATQDNTALVLLFPGGLPGDPRPVLIPWFWVPKEGDWNKHPSQRAMYRTWHDQTFMCFTEGNVTDYREVRDLISRLATQYDIQNLAIDRILLGHEFSTSLQDDGLKVEAFGQGFFSMAAPSKRFEERVLSGEWNHGGNPVLAWMARNATVKEDSAGNIKPVKPKQNSGRKIDGIVAALMALGEWMEAGEKVPSQEVGFFLDFEDEDD